MKLCFGLFTSVRLGRNKSFDLARLDITTNMTFFVLFIFKTRCVYQTDLVVAAHPVHITFVLIWCFDRVFNFFYTSLDKV